MSTAFGLPLADLAVRLFTRWGQENFLRYMMHHFALDLLGEHGLALLPDAERVINPAWRDLAKRRTAADILPEPDRHILRVRVHRSSRPATDSRLQHLVAQLNEAEMTYLATYLQLVYELAGSPVAQTENGISLSSAR